MWRPTLLALLLAAGQVVSQSDVNNGNKKTKEELQKEIDSLIVDNNLDPGSSYRCGVFFAGRPNKKPKAEIFIVPHRFEAQCQDPSPGQYKDRCYNLFSQFIGRLTWDSPSTKRKDEGKNYTMGDDICFLFSQKSNMTAVPNDKIKRGLKVGFYYNFCGQKAWGDTLLRVPDRVCCDEESRFTVCPASANGPDNKNKRNRNGNGNRSKDKE